MRLSLLKELLVSFYCCDFENVQSFFLSRSLVLLGTGSFCYVVPAGNQDGSNFLLATKTTPMPFGFRIRV
jgi:hypothetical protein